ncbi:hypothetical protein L3476_16720 [Paenibacillus thiaminolyticus]|uniref:hypothetical protein n=1 Tax=Paenibacillus thiaminolyticus TaxID=49283 RepID=UPI002350B264|nr:hypothetical protein [Paenibacillus thiaminolyticus]WCR25014.1 hypothetical protein L3476_16720 [Paenibacillus thiaminolyticus]
MEESICSTTMIQQSDEVYVLGDHTKLELTQLYRIAEWSKRRCRRNGRVPALTSDG